MILSVLQSQFKHNIELNNNTTVVGESQKFLPWCHDDILVTEPTPLPPLQATEAVKAIRDFVITLEDSGEWERISFLSFGDRECVFKTASQTNEANQTEGTLSGKNKCQKQWASELYK